MWHSIAIDRSRLFYLFAGVAGKQQLNEVFPALNIISADNISNLFAQRYQGYDTCPRHDKSILVNAIMVVGLAANITLMLKHRFIYWHNMIRPITANFVITMQKLLNIVCRNGSMLWRNGYPFCDRVYLPLHKALHIEEEI